MADTPKTHITYANVRFWLPLIGLLMAWAITWGAMTARVLALERHVAAHDVKIEVMDTTFTEIQITLAQIQSDIAHIREQMDKKQ